MSAPDEAPDHEPISFPEAKRRLGYRRQWRSLLRYLEAVELTRKVRFIGRSKKRGLIRYSVTMAAIDEFAPELTGKRKPKVSAHVGIQEAREFLDTIDEFAADKAAEYVSRRVEPRLARLERHCGLVR